MSGSSSVGSLGRTLGVQLLGRIGEASIVAPTDGFVRQPLVLVPLPIVPQAEREERAGRLSLAARVSHSVVQGVRGLEEGHFADTVVMELIRGLSVAELMRRLALLDLALPSALALRVAMDVCDGLELLRERGLAAHHALDLSEVFVDAAGHVRIVHPLLLDLITSGPRPLGLDQAPGVRSLLDLMLRARPRDRVGFLRQLPRHGTGTLRDAIAELLFRARRVYDMREAVGVVQRVMSVDRSGSVVRPVDRSSGWSPRDANARIDLSPPLCARLVP